MQKITPMLWFDGQAEEAANLYVSLFPNSKITEVSRYTAEGPMPEGTVMVIAFELDGQAFTAAVSFVINCDSQEEIDRFWDALSDGGEIQMCGWLKDKFGVSWTPSVLGELMNGADPEAARRVTQALFSMKKLDIKQLQDAYAGA